MPAATDAMCIHTVDPLFDERWDRFLVGQPAATPYHRSAWIGALADEHPAAQHHLACEDAVGELIGVLPLVLTRGVPFHLGGPPGERRLASLPRTPLGGPVARTPEVAAALLDAAVQLARDQRAVLQVKTVEHGLPDVPTTIQVVPWRKGFVIELPDQPDALRFGNSRNHARISWAVRKAEREGVRVRRGGLADVAAWHWLYLATMRHHAVPARRRTFFEALLARFGDDADLFLAERGEQLLAGSLFVRSGHTVAYVFNGVDRHSLGLRPNDLLMWHAVHRAVAAGAQVLDLGEVDSANVGLAQFKDKWGAREVRLVRCYSPAPLADGRGTGLPARLTPLWRHMPLPVTAWVGGAVNSYL